MSPYIIRWLNNFATNSQSFNEDINKVIANNSYQKVNWYFFSQFLVVFAITTFFFLEYKYKNPFLSYGIAAFILLVTLIGYLGVHSDKNYKEWIELNLKKLIFCFFKKTDKENNNFKKLFTGIINFLFWSFSLVITFSLLLTSIKMATMFSSDVSVSQHFLITISLLLIVLCSNLIFALLHESEKKPWWLWAIPFILVLLIFFIVRDFPIPRNVMKNFQLGNITAEQIILNSEGCKILKGFDQNYLQHKESCTLINYKILSRLGHSFYIETPPCKPPWIYCNPLRFTIPSNHVLSWSMVKPDKEKLTETKGDLKPTKTPDDPKK